MSNARKWLIPAGIVAGLCIAACAVILLVARQAGTQFGRAFKTDATGVAQVGSRIADFDLPPGYEQGAGMSIFMYDFVMYEPLQSSGGMSIFLMQFKGAGGYSTEQMQHAMQQQSGQSAANMKVVSTYQMMIRGQKSTVIIEEGSATSTPAIVIRELIAVFPGKGGTAMLMMTGAKDSWNQPLADKFIASIR